MIAPAQAPRSALIAPLVASMPPDASASSVAAQRASVQWRTRTLFPLAVAILSHAALVREAHVLSMRLGLHVRFQLAVHRPHVCHRSQHDGLDDIRADASVADASLAKAVVRVVDMDRCTIQTWPCAFLAHQVRVMQRMCGAMAWGDMDVRAQVLGPTQPAFAPVAHVLIPLVPCEDVLMPLLPWYGGEAVMGTCRLRVAWTAQQRACQLMVHDVRGLSRRLVSQVHWQVRIGSDTYATQPVDVGADAVCHHTFRRSAWPDAVLATLFGRPTRTLLTEIEAHDQAQEHAATRGTSTYAAHDVAQVVGAPLRMRRPEQDRQWEQWCSTLVTVHMQGAAVQSGAFVARPAPAHLLGVALAQEAAAVAWTHVEGLAMGDVSLRDAHDVVRASDARFLPLQRVAEHPGTALRVHAVWPPAMHDVPPPHAHDTMHATLRLHVACAHEDRPHLTYDVRLAWRWRRAHAPEPPRWDCHSDPGEHVVQRLYRVRWAPHTPGAADLWRADTRNVQVPGSDLLGSWHVRGLSLVRDYYAELVWQRRVRHGMPTVPAWTPPALRADDAFRDLRTLWAGLHAAQPRRYTGHATCVDALVCTHRGWLTWGQRVWCELCGAFLVMRRAPRERITHAILLHRAHVALLSPDAPTIALYTSSASYALAADSWASAHAWQHALAPASHIT